MRCDTSSSFTVNVARQCDGAPLVSDQYCLTTNTVNFTVPAWMTMAMAANFKKI